MRVTHCELRRIGIAIDFVFFALVFSQDRTGTDRDRDADCRIARIECVESAIPRKSAMQSRWAEIISRTQE